MSSEVSAPAASVAPLPDAAPAAVVNEPSAQGDRGVALWVVTIAHTFNHLQGNMTNLLYPVMMTELGFGYFQIGLLTTVYSLMANALQAGFGLITPYVRRSVVLGVGATVLAVATAATGLVQNYGQLLMTRLIGGIGTSPQHPVGSTMLVGLYPKIRGRVLALHTTGGNAGTLLAPLVIGGLVAVMGWRSVFFVVAVPSLLAGLAYFLLRDRIPQTTSREKGRRATLDAYTACLRNRNLLLISAVQMVGAAGRGQGLDIAFLTTHFVNDLGVELTAATLLIAVLQAGGLVGPMLLGWLSDRLPRKAVLLVSLALSAITTWSLAMMGAPGPLLILNLVAYGVVVNSRLVLTQALIADSATGDTADAAYSLYYFVGFISGPLWTLLIGWVMESHGFVAGFTVMAATYVAAMGLIGFIRPPEAQVVARG
ncbi:MAG TPA: MFS transporter [Chloroflexota bacterium]|nr:MFS transporter [Chloroflexota bacterium]